jgi:hypothetical protein
MPFGILAAGLARIKRGHPGGSRPPKGSSSRTIAHIGPYVGQ